MHLRLVAVLAFITVAIPMAAAAQDFGVMNSAETIRRDNFKLMANPVVVFGKDDADNEVGVAVVGGYGFTDRFDMEGKLSFFDALTYFGADAEYWLVKGQSVDVSAIGGFHVGRTEGFNTKGLDITFLASGHVRPRLELYGGLDISRISVDDGGTSYTTVHLVPGIEYAISPKVDFVAEFGIAANDDASHYVSAGIAFYLR